MKKQVNIGLVGTQCYSFLAKFENGAMAPSRQQGLPREKRIFFAWKYLAAREDRNRIMDPDTGI